MDIYEIIAAASIVGGAAVAIIRTWSNLHERQKQHWNMLQKHTELIERLYQKMDDLPDFRHFVDSSFCKEQSVIIRQMKQEIESMSNQISELRNELRTSSRELADERLKWGSYMAKMETMLDERTEKRLRDVR